MLFWVSNFCNLLLNCLSVLVLVSFSISIKGVNIFLDICKRLFNFHLSFPLFGLLGNPVPFAIPAHDLFRFPLIVGENHPLYLYSERLIDSTKT